MLRRGTWTDVTIRRDSTDRLLPLFQDGTIVALNVDTGRFATYSYTPPESPTSVLYNQGILSDYVTGRYYYVAASGAANVVLKGIDVSPEGVRANAISLTVAHGYVVNGDATTVAPNYYTTGGGSDQQWWSIVSTHVYDGVFYIGRSSNRGIQGDWTPSNAPTQLAPSGVLRFKGYRISDGTAVDDWYGAISGRATWRVGVRDIAFNLNIAPNIMRVSSTDYLHGNAYQRASDEAFKGVANRLIKLTYSGDNTVTERTTVGNYKETDSSVTPFLTGGVDEVRIPSIGGNSVHWLFQTGSVTVPAADYQFPVGVSGDTETVVWPSLRLKRLLERRLDDGTFPRGQIVDLRASIVDFNDYRYAAIGHGVALLQEPAALESVVRVKLVDATYREEIRVTSADSVLLSERPAEQRVGILMLNPPQEVTRRGGGLYFHSDGTRYDVNDMALLERGVFAATCTES